MKTKYKYTILALVFALVFIFGSMAAMNYILGIKENQLLTERGRIEVESPVREWKETENTDENITYENTDTARQMLALEQIEEAVESWNNRSEVTLHDRVAGQISMEEAIENGKLWLSAMGISKDLEAESFSISAELGVGKQREETKGQLDAYFSFWTVTYSAQSMNIVLCLNAVTGNVWCAEITLYGEMQEKVSDDGLMRFVEMTGIRVLEGDLSIIDSGVTKTEIAIKESRLYAQEQSYIMGIGFNNCYKRISYQLLINQE